MDEGPITWTQDEVAGVPLQRFNGRLGNVDVGAVQYDGGNRLWIWSTPLAEDAWGWAPSAAGAAQALEAWMRAWLENFRPLLER